MRRNTTVLVTAATAVVAAAIAFPLLATAAGGAGSPAGVAASVADSPGSGHTVAEWNRTLISTLAAPHAQPASVHPTRSFAMVQAAEYNAVVSITHVGRPYRSAVPAAPDARPDAAADQAAHDVMLALYPSMRVTLDSQLARQLAGLPAGTPTRNGVSVGSAAARALLTEREADGSATPPAAFVAGTAPGAYRRTPPKFGPPMFTSWGSVRPFLLEHASQFRPAPPPPINTPGYTAVLAEVKSIGQDSSTTRTPDQTVAGTFWSSAPVWNTWNQIAQQVAADRHAGLAETTAAFSALDLALADTTIAMYDAKYADHVWRPVTAIQQSDPAWSPLTPTAADPSYPGAHSALSAAAATALTAFYGSRQDVTVTSAADPGVSRHFASLADVADEAALSRIWAGQHTRIDDEAGRQLGRQVADVVLDDLQVHRAAG
jgi:hypothetical protein